MNIRNVFRLALLAGLLAACASDKKETGTTTTNGIALAEKALPIIKGVWVPLAYSAEIEKTKSPFKAYSKLQGLAAIVINNTAATEDSLEVGVSYNNHEGSSMTVYFKQGHSTNSFVTNYKQYEHESEIYELEYQATKKDTLLFVKHYASNGWLLGSKEYERVSNSTTATDLGWGIEQVVNKKLLAGSYNVEGATPPLVVKFNQNGTVTGFEGFTSYFAGTDFAMNDPDELPGSDYIYFEKQGSNESIAYGFKIQADTLVLSLHDTHYKLVRR